MRALPTHLSALAFLYARVTNIFNFELTSDFAIALSTWIFLLFFLPVALLYFFSHSLLYIEEEGIAQKHSEMTAFHKPRQRTSEWIMPS